MKRSICRVKDGSSVSGAKLAATFAFSEAGSACASRNCGRSCKEGRESVE